MPEITKETFLKAEDPKNRDAMLFDMLKSIDEKTTKVLDLKEDIEKCEKQLAFIKGVGKAITTIFSLAFAGVAAWLAKL
jgi:hypothetical protein